MIRREIAGNKTLPPDHGITRHNKPQRPPDHGHNTDNKPQRKHSAPRAPDDTYGITEVVAFSSKERPTRAVPSSGRHQSASFNATRVTPKPPLHTHTTHNLAPMEVSVESLYHLFWLQAKRQPATFFKPKPKLWSFGRFDHGRELHLAADGSSSNRMHSSSKHLLRILDMKQIGTKHTFWEPNAIICKGIPSCLHTSLLHQHVDYV